jgi:hypothetical protein
MSLPCTGDPKSQEWPRIRGGDDTMESNGVWGVNGVVCVGGVLLAAASVCGSAGNEAIALVNVSAHDLSAVSTRQN